MIKGTFFHRYDLSQYNSLKLKSVVDRYVAISDTTLIPDVIKEIGTSKFIILGCATNTILPEFYAGVAIKLTNSHLAQQESDVPGKIIVSADSGVLWDDLVAYTLQHDCFGLENLSAIPGTVGASPVQNIGAYGAEVGQYINSIDVYDLHNKSFRTLNNLECHFQYRSSVFKNNNQYIIISVNFLLNTRDEPNTQYLDLQKYTGQVSGKELRDIVINIRNSKLPSLDLLPNVGSFFQNPILSKEQYANLKKIAPDIVAFKVLDEQFVKISAAYLIDKSGLKPFFMNGFSVYHKHALVLVNYNNTGVGNQHELLELAYYVQRQVLQKYGVQLHIEPNIIK